VSEHRIARLLYLLALASQGPKSVKRRFLLSTTPLAAWYEAMQCIQVYFIPYLYFYIAYLDFYIAYLYFLYHTYGFLPRHKRRGIQQNTFL